VPDSRLDGAILNAIIQERKFSFRSEYDISSNGSTFYARKTFFSFFNKLQLQSRDGNVIARIQGRFSLLRNKYDFELSDDRVYHFRCEKLWKPVFLCERSEESYRLYQHKGRDDRQIAAFSKNRVTIGKGNRYEILMNADADLIVIVCMVLALNTSQDNDNKETVNIDFGNIGPEAKPFDEFWQPG
jgi:uncharacterized protein YxjI